MVINFDTAPRGGRSNGPCLGPKQKDVMLDIAGALFLSRLGVHINPTGWNQQGMIHFIGMKQK